MCTYICTYIYIYSMHPNGTGFKQLPERLRVPQT